MKTCQTSVEKGAGWQACGEPATEIVRVGAVYCYYCQRHAEAARRFVERIGQGRITLTQFQARRDFGLDG